ncbi:MAG: hypothetical protein ACRBCT_01570 [Alphaproteobacteria bacterium]
MDTINTQTWTPKRRAEQAERCRKNKPSQHATGPKTAAGKAASSQNAYKHGLRSTEMQELSRLLTQQEKILRDLNKHEQ